MGPALGRPDARSQAASPKPLLGPQEFPGQGLPQGPAHPRIPLRSPSIIQRPATAPGPEAVALAQDIEGHPMEVVMDEYA
jgi:hypothetical protein